jgi:SAM-dependent methyltransferase
MKEEEWNAVWLDSRNSNLKKIKKFFEVFNFYNIPKSSKIVDIGCGIGDALFLLKKKGYNNLEGIEPEKSLFEDMDPYKIITQGSCLDLNVIKEKKDIIIMFGVLHHLKNFDDMKLCLNNIDKILASKGKFYSVEPWKNIIRTIITKLVLETPLCNISKYLKNESRLYEEEKKEFNNWLTLEKDFTRYAKSIGFNVIFSKKDLRNRYLIFEKK